MLISREGENNDMRVNFRAADCLLLLFLFSSTVAFAQENNGPPEGFTALFNGRDFDDWTGGATRDPREVEALPPAERAEHDAQMARRLKQHWRVEDGMLVSDGNEPYLATTQKFGDFELWVD